MNTAAKCKTLSHDLPVRMVLVCNEEIIRRTGYARIGVQKECHTQTEAARRLGLHSSAAG